MQTTKKPGSLLVTIVIQITPSAVVRAVTYGSGGIAQNASRGHRNPAAKDTVPTNCILFYDLLLSLQRFGLPSLAIFVTSPRRTRTSMKAGLIKAAPASCLHFRRKGTSRGPGGK